jgi:hypothetical protein
MIGIGRIIMPNSKSGSGTPSPSAPVAIQARNKSRPWYNVRSPRSWSTDVRANITPRAALPLHYDNARIESLIAAYQTKNLLRHEEQKKAEQRRKAKRF